MLEETQNGIIHNPHHTPMTTTAAAASINGNDARTMGAVRTMDLIMYVLYSDDQNFVRDMVTKVALEVSAEQDCSELTDLTLQDSPQLYRCLFFLLMDFHAKFRFWVLGETGTGLQPVCPYKAVRFLKTLRAEIVPRFLINETVRLDEFERQLKLEYIRS
jgi:hypothetical protein